MAAPRLLPATTVAIAALLGMKGLELVRAATPADALGQNPRESGSGVARGTACRSSGDISRWGAGVRADANPAVCSVRSACAGSH
jgi:hypothetical protein